MSTSNHRIQADVVRISCITDGVSEDSGVRGTCIETGSSGIAVEAVECVARLSQKFV